MVLFSNINDALKEYSSGKMIIVMDDETRENEGDIVINARFASKENITFIKNNTSGILCAVITPDKAKRLELNPMVERNTDNHQTAFTVTCDSVHSNTGVSSEDRYLTLHALYSENIGLRKPGHMFPLIARPDGLKERRGHTEAVYELNRLTCPETFDKEVGLISELVNEDGTMMRYPDAKKFADKYSLSIINIQQILELI